MAYCVLTYAKNHDRLDEKSKKHNIKNQKVKKMQVAVTACGR